MPETMLENIPAEKLNLIIAIVALSFFSLIAYKLSFKIKAKMEQLHESHSNENYSISSKKYNSFKKKSQSVIINTTLAFTETTNTSVPLVDRGYAGYETVVSKGVALLQRDNVTIPSLEAEEYEQYRNRK